LIPPSHFRAAVPKSWPPLNGLLVCLLVCLLLLSGARTSQAAPVRLIFDTDIGNDIDDALALAMIHAFESRGEAKLLAVTITKDNLWAAPFVDLVNTFYQRPEIPIGTVRHGKTPDDSKYIQIPSESGWYPHKITDGQQAPDAVTLLRKTLAGEKDGSVIFVQVGFSTNLSRLLDSQPDQASLLAGRDLVKRKVKSIVAMAGGFPTGNREYNVYIDIPAARKLFADAPVPVVASGYEVGSRILYPASSIEKDFAYVPHHPITDAYRLYKSMPYDRPTWDLTAVLYAVRPKDSFSLSGPGRVEVDDEGKTKFTPDKNSNRRYLTATPEQASHALKVMIELAAQPPGKWTGK
jgi:inosine-uridine nucleoside N-ribohydrolase